jgi:hypothetical protein
MSGLKLNEQEIRRWFRDNGDHTHNINYDLSENSIIMDLGGYKGLWAQQMIDKYNPHVYILEPVPVFYETMLTKFSNNKKVRLIKFLDSINHHKIIIEILETYLKKNRINKKYFIT